MPANAVQRSNDVERCLAASWIAMLGTVQWSTAIIRLRYSARRGRESAKTQLRRARDHGTTCPTPVAGPFDFRLGIDADVDRIGVFLPGIAHGC